MDGKKACEKLLDAMQLEKQSYRVGTSKVICSFEWQKNQEYLGWFSEIFQWLKSRQNLLISFSLYICQRSGIEMIY